MTHFISFRKRPTQKSDSKELFVVKDLLLPLLELFHIPIGPDKPALQKGRLRAREPDAEPRRAVDYMVNVVSSCSRLSETRENQPEARNLLSSIIASGTPAFSPISVRMRPGFKLYALMSGFSACRYSISFAVPALDAA